MRPTPTTLNSWFAQLRFSLRSSSWRALRSMYQAVYVMTPVSTGVDVCRFVSQTRDFSDSESGVVSSCIGWLQPFGLRDGCRAAAHKCRYVRVMCHRGKSWRSFTWVAQERGPYDRLDAGSERRRGSNWRTRQPIRDVAESLPSAIVESFLLQDTSREMWRIVRKLWTGIERRLIRRVEFSCSVRREQIPISRSSRLKRTPITHKCRYVRGYAAR